MCVQRVCAGNRIYRRNNSTQHIAPFKRRIAHQRVDDWGWIGEARGLNDQAPEGGNLALISPAIERQERLSDITTYRAAKTTRCHFDDLVIGVFDQKPVKADLTKFVHDNCSISKPGFG